MKRLMTLLFALAVAFSLTMPVFAQETGGGQEAPKAEKAEKKHKKHHKGGKKAKKGAAEGGATEAPK